MLNMQGVLWRIWTWYSFSEAILGSFWFTKGPCRRCNGLDYDLEIGRKTVVKLCCNLKILKAIFELLA